MNEGKAKPLEGLASALELFVKHAKGGNYCMVVVDGCWINHRIVSKKKALYCQVAGDKYIPAMSRLKPEHVALLEGMGITREEGSVDIFSVSDPLAGFDAGRVAKRAFTAFNDVLRVSKGAEAYLEIVLGSKPDPAFEPVLASVAGLLPDRRSGNKFYWRWS